MTLEERLLLCRAGYTMQQIAEMENPTPNPAPAPTPSPAPAPAGNAPAPAPAPTPAPDNAPTPNPAPAPAVNDNSAILSALADMQKAIVSAVQSASLGNAVLPPPTGDDLAAIMAQIINPYDEKKE